MTVTAYGVTIPTEEEIRNTLIAAVRADVDAALDLSPDSPEGALLGAVVPSLREAHEGVAEAATSYDEAQAEGAALATLAALSGVSRIEGRATRIAATVTLDAGVTLPANTTRAYVVGHQELTAHLVETVTSTAAGQYSAVFALDTLGAITVAAGTLTQILTPVGGWSAVTNPSDGIPGRAAETDEELRTRRRVSTGKTGRGTVSALLANVLELANVGSAQVFENPTDYMTAAGVAPHSFEVLVDLAVTDTAGLNEVAATIYGAQVGGYRPAGTACGYAQDATTGNWVLVPFTVVTQIPIYVAVTVRATSVTAAQVQDAIVNAMGDLGVGYDVVQLRVAGAVQAILGRDEYVVSCYIGTAAAPTLTTTITVDSRSRATFAAGRVAVTFS